MRYANDAGVVSHLPEQLEKMLGGMMVASAVFGFTVAEAKTEMICVYTKGRQESAAIFSVETAGLV